MVSWYYPSGIKSDQINDFVNFYKPYVYDKSLKLTFKDKTIRVFNKNSLRDDETRNRLLRCGIQNSGDLRSIIEWKTGWIFCENSNTCKTRYWDIVNYSNFFDRIMENIDEQKCMCSQSHDNARTAFLTLHDIKKRTDAKGIGSVYILTLLYFLSKGKYPIYDQFAHISCMAITNDISPTNTTNYIPLHGNPERAWEDYLAYCKLINEIFGIDSISPDEDLALWVYGHCFNRK